MNKSESIAALATAVAMAQGEVENADKNSTNPHFRSKYADLAEILNTVRPVLSKHGLSVMQFPSFSDGVAHVETVIAHKSGEWMSETCSAPVQKADPQGVGSALTYLRRYSLAAIVGVAQEDDDGNDASKQPQRQQQRALPQQQHPEVQPQKATSKQLAAIMAAFDGSTDEDMLSWCNEFYRRNNSKTRVSTIAEISSAAASAMIKELMPQGA